MTRRFDIIIDTHRVSLLPLNIRQHKLGIRVNGLLGGPDDQKDRCETITGVWNKGTRSGDVTWPRGSGGLLQWAVEDKRLGYVRTYQPKIKLYCYAFPLSSDHPSVETSQLLGWTQLDVRDLQSKKLHDVALPLKAADGGSTGISLYVSASIAVRPNSPSTPQKPALMEPTILHTPPVPDSSDCLPIGSGSDIYDLELTLEGTGGLLALAPELEDLTQGQQFWFSFAIFDILIQSQTFNSLAYPRFPVTTDSFRLKGSWDELAACLEQLSPLQVFLCTTGRELGVFACEPPVAALRSTRGSIERVERTYPLNYESNTMSPSEEPPWVSLKWSIRSLSVKAEEPETYEQSEINASAFLDEQPMPKEEEEELLSTVANSPAEESHHSAQSKEPVVTEAHHGPSESETSRSSHHSENASLRDTTSGQQSPPPQQLPIPPALPDPVQPEKQVRHEQFQSRSHEEPRAEPEPSPWTHVEHSHPQHPLQTPTSQREQELAFRQWQAEQEKVWLVGLKEKERAMRTRLEEEFKQAEADRAAAVKRMVENYRELETKLRESLNDVERQKRAIAAAEDDTKQKHTRKLAELQLLQQKLREEAKHEVAVERHRRELVEANLKAMRQEKDNLEQTVNDLRQALRDAQDRDRKSPEHLLRAEIARLQGDNAQKDSMISEAMADKHKALLEKEQYRSYVHQLHRALKNEQNKQVSMAKQQAEQLRVEYLAREEKFVLDGDRQELERIKRELDELRSAPQQIEQKPEIQSKSAPKVSYRNDHLLRLRQEKDDLLSKGYPLDDPIIQQLNNFITSAETEAFS